MADVPEIQDAEDEAELDFSPRRGALVLALLMALYILSYVDRSILSLLIQPIKRDLGLSDTQVSLLVGAAFSIFYATTALPLGYVADRWNRRNLIAIAVALWSVMTALGGIAHNYTLLFLTRMGVGLGEAALAPAAYSMISDIFPKRLLGRAMALFALSASVGSGLALILGSFVVHLVGQAETATLPGIGETATWRAVLIVVGLPGLLLAALMYLVTEPRRRGLTAVPASASAPRRSALAFVRRNARVLLPLYFGLGSISIVYYGMLTWTPTLFLRRFGIAPADIALPLGLAFAIGGVAGMLAGGFWADRLWQRGVKDGYMRVIFYSAAGSLPFYTAMPLMPTPALVLAALFGGAFCQGLQSGLPAGSVQMITPNDLRARVIAGCFLTVGLMGLGLGPTVVALGVDLLFGEAGLGQAMALSNGIVLAAASLILLAGLKPFRQAVAAPPA
ncbi:spinster family MFS transporter [Sphingosinicella terrae]|uniref:spinster family MFS transporter n=1 Tax=Sphingosinicella terrae TaxID=2172047 RepID=UPI000E0D1FC4|nr:MFS transporter [Sphingosinicella terrae]